MTASSSIPDVKQFVLDHFLVGEDPNKLDPTTPLVSGGIMDSTDLLDLIAFLEKRYQIEFTAHETDPVNFDTMNAIDALVQSKLGGRKG
jgi:acyl carrier protein